MPIFTSFHREQDLQIKCLRLCAYLCILEDKNTDHVCVCVYLRHAWPHFHICISVGLCTDMCVFVLLHVSIKMKQITASICGGSLFLPPALAISHSSLGTSSTPRTFLHNPIRGSVQSICTGYFFNYAIHPLHMLSTSQFPFPTPSSLSISAAIFSLFLQFLCF